MVRAILQNVSPKDLSIHLFDSDKGRMTHTARLIREVLQDTNTDIKYPHNINLIEITESRHPEIFRRRLEEKQLGREENFLNRKYNIFLSRTDFDSFNNVVPGDRGQSFSGEKCVKELTSIEGLTKMLSGYLKLLIADGAKFFTAHLVDSPTPIEPGFGDDFREDVHRLNLIEDKEDTETRKAPKITKIEYTEDDEQMKERLAKMFKHFDFVASLTMKPSKSQS